jgi:hypothetical protein
MRDRGFDVMVDAARDVLRSLVTQSESAARAVPERWFQSRAPLLRRLAIHGVDIAPSLTADEKIQWVLEKDLLFDFSMKHEVFTLMKNALPSAGQVTKRSLLKRARKGVLARDEPRLSRETRAYEKYNLIVWLARVAPEDREFQRALSDEQGRHPEFAPREHPDADITEPEIVPVPPPSGESVDVFISKDVRDVAVVRSMLEEEGEDWPSDGRWRTSERVAAAVAKRSQLGTRLGEDSY